MLKPEGVITVAAIGGPARRLHIRRSPGLRADRAQKCRGMEGAGPHFHVVGLQNDAPPVRPVTLEREDQVLKGARRRLERSSHSREYRMGRSDCPALQKRPMAVRTDLDRPPRHTPTKSAYRRIF